MVTVTHPIETTVEWESIITLEHVSNPATKQDIAAMLDKIEASPTGQKVLNDIAANMVSEDLHDGRFTGEKVKITDSIVADTLGGYVQSEHVPLFYGENTEIEGDSVVVNMNYAQLADIEFIATNGQLFKPSTESILLHELAHVADGEGMQEKAEAAVEKANLEATLTAKIDEALDVNSEYHQTLTPEQKEAVDLINTSLQQQRELAKQKAEGAETIDVRKLGTELIPSQDVFQAYKTLGQAPELSNLSDKITAASIELREQTNVSESVAMNTANAYRAENNELHFRGHYDAARITNDSQPLDIFERADFMEMHAEWREKYGINKDPNIPDDLIRGVDLKEEIQNQIRDMIPDSLKNTLALGDDSNALDRPIPGDRQQSPREIG